MGPEFFSREGTVVIEGWADPGSVVELYRSQSTPNLHHGPLREPLTTVTVDESELDESGDATAHLHAAAGRPEDPGHQLEEGGLSGAVGA